MAEHDAVARRFGELLESLEMTRAAFVAAVDGAISERTLYSILNGHRRPSRSLAVLIERTWGFRADYLLNGEGAAWATSGARSSGSAAADDADVISALLRESPELARTLRRDLDDSVLWTELWQRTTRMLADISGGGSAGVCYPADRARIAFTECMSVADAFGELAATRYRRRVLHMVVSFIGRALEDLRADPGSGLDGLTFSGLLAEAETAREQLGAKESALREQLAERVGAASPLEVLDALAPEAVAGRLLADRIRTELARHSP